MFGCAIERAEILKHLAKGVRLLRQGRQGEPGVPGRVKPNRSSCRKAITELFEDFVRSSCVDRVTGHE